MTTRPLVLLDVDGVLHDRRALLDVRSSDNPQATAHRLGVTIVVSHGHRLAFPYHMPKLVQHLAEVAELWWCSTWRHRANDEIREHLGIDPLRVLDDGTRAVGLQWKIAAAAPMISQAASRGRIVYWIEDFNGTYPNLDNDVIYVDTGFVGFLKWSDLPKDLRRRGIPQGGM